jgi:hypothetical protein
MRLTLRTLLAWRDGLLSPADHEELSEKMKAASVARNLLDRMNALEKRRDVEMPKVEGKGLAVDANSVAEYLENVMEPEKLEAFEQICLSSDRHLAEISECHKIIAADLTDGSHAGPSSTQLCDAVAGRLAGGSRTGQAGQPDQSDSSEPSVIGEAGAARQPSIPRAGIRPTAEVPGAGAQPAVVIDSAAKQPVAKSRRGKRRGHPWLQAAAAIGLLGASVVVLAVMVRWDSGDDPSSNGPVEAALQPEAAPQSEPQSESPPAEFGRPNQEEAVVAASPEAPLPDSADGTDASAVDPTTPETAATAGAVPVAPDPPLGSGPSVPMGDALAIAAPLAPNPESLLPPIPAPEPPGVVGESGSPAVHDPLGQKSGTGVVSGGPLLLVAEVEQPSQWRGCFPGDQLESGLHLLAPPASEPEIEFGSVVVRLAPRSQLVVRESGDDRIDLELLFGRAAVRRRTGDALVVLRAGGLNSRLSGPPGALIVRVELSCEPGVEQEPGHEGLRSVVVDLIEGEMGWTQLDGSAILADMPPDGAVSQGMSVTWNSLEADQATRGVAAVPSWEAFSESVHRLDSEAILRFVNAVRERGDVIEAARTLASSSRVEDREVAAGTLALVGDYSAAVAMLCGSAIGERLGERRWRLFEREVIPLAIARGVHSAERLRKAFVDELPDGDGERVFQFAQGFSDEHLEAGGDTELVASLDATRLVVRRYAVLRLEELIKISPRDQLRYRADATPSMRAEGLRWWAIQLEKGLIRRQEAGQLSVPKPG